LPSSTTPLLFDAHVQGNPREYPHTPYISGNYNHWATLLSLTVWVYLHSFSRGSTVVASQICELAQNSVKI